MNRSYDELNYYTDHCINLNLHIYICLCVGYDGEPRKKTDPLTERGTVGGTYQRSITRSYSPGGSTR